MPKTLADAFNSRANSIGFLRWLLAFMVIFSHAGPLGGFYGGRDLGTQWSTEQSLGGVAVCGFFFFSGFLITKSRKGKSSTLRYFWRRGMRIIPAWWLILIFTAFILGPLAWVKQTGGIGGYFTSASESPLTYFVNNMWLAINQLNILGMGAALPSGGVTWNGSAWTLAYEFGAYILVGVLGLLGILAHRRLAGLVAAAIILLACLQWLHTGDLTNVSRIFTNNIYILLLLAPFALGMLFALFADKVLLDDRVAVAAIVIAAGTYAFGGWLVFGQYFFCYFLMWFAVRATKLQRWERFGDFSYGIYLSAWPVMQFVAYFGLQNHGWLAYHFVVILLCHMFAFVSWHLIEKPAMSLKNWTPRWLARGLDKLQPVNMWVKQRLVNPEYSSSAFAVHLRALAEQKKKP